VTLHSLTPERSGNRWGPEGPGGVLHVVETIELAPPPSLLQIAWLPMPLTEDEWRAFANEHLAAMNDAEIDLHGALEGLRRGIQGLVDRGMLPTLEGDSLWETFREALLRVQARLNAYMRRLMQMQRDGEL